LVVFRKKQARRLLFDRSGNDDHERSILTKLKELLGGQLTSKMEGMVSHMSFISLVVTKVFTNALFCTFVI